MFNGVKSSTVKLITGAPQGVDMVGGRTVVSAVSVVGCFTSGVCQSVRRSFTCSLSLIHPPTHPSIHHANPDFWGVALKVHEMDMYYFHFSYNDSGRESGRRREGKNVRGGCERKKEGG